MSSLSLSRRALLGGAVGSTAIAGSGLVSPSFAETCMTLEPGKKKSLYGPDPDKAHLVFNENPFGPSKGALKALAEASTQGAYYQGESTQYLMDMIAERHGVSPAQVLITNGSYEGLTAIAIAYAKDGDTLGADLYWDTTALYAERNGFNKIVRSPMAEDMNIDLDAMEAMVNDGVGLVHIVNPNNPTGLLLDTAKLRDFVNRVSQKKPVLIDEAYIELTDDPEGNSMMDLVREGKNVIIARTFSKIYGMAGLRVGYTIASEETIERLRSYVVTSPAVAGIAAAINSYNDDEFLTYSKNKLLEAREMIIEGAKANGLTPLPSQASFVFVDVKGDANRFRDRMAEKGVSIRGTYGDYTAYSRVSCGYARDVKRYVEALPYAVG